MAMVIAMASQAALNPRHRPSAMVPPPDDNAPPNGNAPPGKARRGNSQTAGLLFLLAVLLVMVATGWLVLHWMRDAQRLPISQLVVTGERHYTRDDDIRQAILALGTPGTFMTQDVNTIQQQIERLPWIKQVSVRKQWPDELKIHLVEYVPVAHWNQHYLVDSLGNIFSVPPERLSQRAQQLLWLSGPPDSQLDVLHQAQTMAQVLRQAQLTPPVTLQTAAMTARHAWLLTLHNGVQLHLGRNEVLRRLQRFIVLYPVLRQQEQQNGKQLNYVDLRYESGAAAGWQPANSTENSHSSAP